MAYYVYILKSAVDGRYYIGQTNNLTNRLKQHNEGKSRYTKPYVPWSVLAFKVCTTRAEAMSLEKRIKNLKSRTRIH